MQVNINNIDNNTQNKKSKKSLGFFYILTF